MKSYLNMKLSLAVISISLIVVFSVCDSGGENRTFNTWIVLWNSGENLDNAAGTDFDIFMTRSTDSGATWSAVQTINSDANTDSGFEFAPRVIPDGYGNWVAVWWSEDNPGDPGGDDYDIFVSHSTDDGITWSAEQTLNSNANSDAGGDRDVSVMTDGNGTWIAVWYSGDDLGGTVDTDFDIFFARSTDNGASWSAVQALNSNAATDTERDYTPSLAVDEDGTWIAAWHTRSDLGGTIGTDYDILFARSTDNGASWSAVQALNSNAGPDSGDDFDPCLMVNSKGVWCAVWSSTDENYGTDADIVYTCSVDNGASWWSLQNLNIDASFDAGGDVSPRVMADDNGNWVTAWRSNENPGGLLGPDNDIFIAYSTDYAGWWQSAPTYVSNAASDSGNDETPYILTDGNGNWGVVWNSNENLGGSAGTDYDIFITRSTDNGVSWSEVQTLNSNATTDTGDDFMHEP